MLDYSRRTLNVTELVKEKTNENNLRMFHRVEPAPLQERKLSTARRNGAKKHTYATLPASFSNGEQAIETLPISPTSEARTINIRMQPEQK